MDEKTFKAFEDFALSGSRAEVLKSMPHGTEVHSFLGILDHIQTYGSQAPEELDALLEAHKKRFPYSSYATEMDLKRLLLKYDTASAKDQKALLKELNDKFLHYSFEHARPNYASEAKAASTGKATETHPSVLNPSKSSVKTLLSEAPSNLSALQKLSVRGLQQLDISRLDFDGIKHVFSCVPVAEMDPQTFINSVKKYIKKDKWTSYSNLCNPNELTVAQLELLLGVGDAKEDYAVVQPWLRKKFQCGRELTYAEQVVHCKTVLRGLGPLGHTSTSVTVKVSLQFHALQLLLKLNRKGFKVFKDFLGVPRGANYLKDHSGFLSMFKRFGSLDSSIPAQLGMDTSFYIQELKLVETYLFRFLKDQPDSKLLESYFNQGYIIGAFAKIKLMAGDPDPKWAAIYTEKRGANAYETLLKEQWLRFAPHCKALYTPTDPVVLPLKLKGINTLVVRTFEINVNNYYRTTWKPLSSDLNLDGIIPNTEETFTFDAPQPVISSFEYTSNFISQRTRGVFVVEVISSGLSSRAIVRKGQLKCATRLTPKGHSICILSENNEICQGESTGIMLDTRFFPVDETGLITIPYSEQPRSTKVIVQHEGYSELSEFQLYGEDYKLKAGFLCPVESVVVGSNCRVLVRPFLTVNKVECPLELLQKAKAGLLLEDFDGVVRTKAFPLDLQSGHEAVLEFQVPPKVKRLCLSLEAQVLLTSTGLWKGLKTKTFELPINSSIPTKGFAELYLRSGRQVKGRAYMLQVLGRTGEGQPGVSVIVNLRHRYAANPLEDVTLITDENGEITLGGLEGIVSLSASAAFPTYSINRSFTIEDKPLVFPKQQYCLSGSLTFPYYLVNPAPAKSADKKVQEAFREEVSLLRIDKHSSVLDNLTQSLHFQPDEDNERSGFFSAELGEGSYLLRYHDYNASTVLQVASGKVWNSAFIISPTSIIDMRGADPAIRISSLSFEGNMCKVQVRGQDSTCRVHVFAYHFWESTDEGIFDRLMPTSRSMPLPVEVPKVASMYLNERKLGEEYSYVLERRSQERFLGCTLEKPQLLLKRLYIQDTKTDIQEAKTGQEYEKKTIAAASAAAKQSTQKLKKVRVLSAPFHDFLQTPALILPNITPDVHGLAVAELDLSLYSHVVVVAVQGNIITKRCRALPLSPLPLRDLTCTCDLDPEQHYCQTLVTAPVKEFEAVTIEDIASVEMQVVDSVQKVEEAYKALGGNWVRDWEFLTQWSRLNEEEKGLKYWEFASHELNFFLWRKDREYFNRVVGPFLANKLEKDVVDHFLLDTPDYDWTKYLSLHALQALNPFEQLLVLTKVRASHPAVHEAACTRLRCQGKAVEMPPERWLQVFETILQLETVKTGSATVPHSYTATAIPSSSRMYHELEATQEYVETRYYGLQMASSQSVIRVSPFWADAMASALQEQPFLSQNFAYESWSSCGGILALALLDLPLVSSEHGLRAGQGREATLKAASNLLLFRKQVKSAPFDQQHSVLVAQRFFDPAEQFTYNDKNQKVEKPVEEFLVRQVYACQVILTNVSSVNQSLSVMWQLPVGALPVGNMDYSKNITETVGPFSTRTREFFFYFPKAGQYAMFPAEVAKNGVVVGSFHMMNIEVKAVRTLHDPTSLHHVLADGSTADLLSFIETQNIFDQQRTKFTFSDLLYLLKEDTFYLQLVTLLRSKRVFEESVWKFALLHNDPASLKELLRYKAGTLASELGPWFESSLLVIRPEDSGYRHLEYAPIANARIYRLGQEKKILNGSLKGQYERFIKTIAYIPTPLLGEKELLPLVYYLILQDRVTQALTFFSQVQPTTLWLQYDYLSAYFEFLQGSSDFQASRRVMEKYRNYPVLTWNRYFAEIRRQVQELDGQTGAATDSRESKQDVLAASEPVLTARLEGDELLLSSRHVSAINVNYHVLDLEVFFSLNPFQTSTSPSGFSYVKPSLSESIPVDSPIIRHRIPESIRHKAVQITVTSGALHETLSYFNNSKLRVHVFEAKGHLRVTNIEGKGVPQVYVKTFALFKSGGQGFYKDGYTDLRGVFDYVALNTVQLSTVQKFAVMVLDDELGGLVREAQPPTL